MGVLYCGTGAMLLSSLLPMNSSALPRIPARLLHFAVLTALLATPAAGSDPQESPVTGLSFVGRTVLPRGLEFEGTRVGGLSGLAWDEESKRFWAISDDRGQHGPVRAYRFRIDLAVPGAVTPPAVTVDGMLALTDAKGRPYPPASIDTEGIALAKGAFFVSTEAIVHRGVAAVIGEHGPDGRLRRELSFRPDTASPRAAASARTSASRGSPRAATAGSSSPASRTPSPRMVRSPGAGVPSPARILRFDLEKKGPPRSSPTGSTPSRPLLRTGRRSASTACRTSSLSTRTGFSSSSASSWRASATRRASSRFRSRGPRTSRTGIHLPARRACAG
ncbi:MAG: esterase-like activity of phytase family protein [Holophagales bacterium]|nr:esterase-like activity of phytase family protein [Holophagales bacterium]